ncbi:MAG TPA: hypothetical protein VHB30_05405 [Solirubrobacteraceae bacterium]|jgi:hypothetical protein|nr:hypothetical protein [Solirubrobacteraceae bacterium]
MMPETPTTPAVSCLACGRAWNSGAMADGLRLLGSCPRCGGALAFRDDAPADAPGPGDADAALEPHLVLGIPRR